MAFWRFDDEGAVIKYDAWIPSLDDWIELVDGAPTTDPEYRSQTIQRVCGAADSLCNGKNKQWDSVEECIVDLSQRSYGTYNDAWGDNVVCRTIHVVLTQSRPEVRPPPWQSPSEPREPPLTLATQHHCPHVGPTGGGKCVEVPYPEDFLDDEGLYGEPVGETFTC